MKRVIVVIFFMTLIPLYANWGDYGLTPVSISPSGLEGSMKYELKDSGGRTFYVNAPGEPDRETMKKILRHRETFLSWSNIRINKLSFYMYGEGIQAVVVPASVRHNGTELKPYLPSGFTFIGKNDRSDYQYRIIVGNTSLKLEGTYRGEEPMIEEMHAYIRGIREGTIIVEDEKVVSGSVVSFLREKEQGERQVHPVGDLPRIDSGAETAGGDTGGGKLKWFVSAQGTYLYPVRIFGDIFVSGYGFNASVGLCDVGFSFLNKILFNIELEFTAGYWSLKERRQREEYESYAVNNAYIVPLGLMARYRVGITDKFSVVPALGFGYYYNKLEYDKLLPDGTYRSVSVREWNPALTAGLRCDYRFDKVCIFGGVEYLLMFERRLNITALLFSAGSGYMF
ncbi:MAG TPA: hypothetical protein PLI62_04975 [Spirochaetota bacterium]|nr:hypothetical protein [Spirochaetota bacterium]